MLRILAPVLAALVVASPALSMSKRAQQRAVRQQLQRYYHATGYLRSIGRVARRTIYSPNPAVSFKWKLTVRYLARARADARRKLYALRQPPRPAHYAGWLCIHGGEGAWNDNTGNGFYGGLQAHIDWYGVHRMDLLSPIQQMWAAEHAYASVGYSHLWLAGQWPNSYPPCASYF